VNVLPRRFYARPTLAVLDDLIGKVLVHQTRGQLVSGVIVEAEAYIGEDDPACHAASGPTARNRPLYGEPGFSYVYLNYGLHHLVNAVTEPAGRPAAILIRALEPLDGSDVMLRRRLRLRRRQGLVGRAPDDLALCRGPGNLTVAFGIGVVQNVRDLTGGPLRIEDRGIVPRALVYTPRIGIRVGTAAHWRCCWKGHPSLSGGG